jgi:acyl-CoA synthetase (AMP-forming)/AMP-acid ligase II
MIKSSGYRISPNEVEEVLYASGMIGECAAFGAPHPALGQVVVVVATAADPATFDLARLQLLCRERMPGYMVPATVDVRDGPLPRNANGKIDRKALAGEFGAAAETAS